MSAPGKASFSAIVGTLCALVLAAAVVAWAQRSTYMPGSSALEVAMTGGATLTGSGGSSTLALSSGGAFNLNQPSTTGKLSLCLQAAGTSRSCFLSDANSSYALQIFGSTGNQSNAIYLSTAGATDERVVGSQYWDLSSENTNGSTDISNIIHALGSGEVGILTASPQTALDVAGAVRAEAGTYSTLPACSSTTEGAMRGVTDSATTTWGHTITGGGSGHVLAYCDGTNWTVAAN